MISGIALFERQGLLNKTIWDNNLPVIIEASKKAFENYETSFDVEIIINGDFDINFIKTQLNNLCKEYQYKIKIFHQTDHVNIHHVLYLSFYANDVIC